MAHPNARQASGLNLAGEEGSVKTGLHVPRSGLSAGGLAGSQLSKAGRKGGCFPMTPSLRYI